MIKAAAGGGGRGMRRADDVTDERDLRALFEAAQKEASASFGNGDLLLERLLERARHVEVQVFGDAHGNYVHLGERDCSTQRRNQKILEESPAPGVSDTLRAALGEAAIRLAREVGYVGAGTVEFLMEPDGRFHFLEMNTRLQVEHPVTEAVTGLDLVEWQLRIAMGEPLPRAQDEIRLEGHSIEARLCAEDPWAGFAPQSGDILAWALPSIAGVRVDHGLSEQATVPAYYDSMIAKVIAHGATREQARQRLIAALGKTSVLGITHNRDYLIACLRAAPFVDAELATRWLGDISSQWSASAPDSRWLATACAVALVHESTAHGALANWSSSGPRTLPYTLSVGGKASPLSVRTLDATRFHITGDGWQHEVVCEPPSGTEYRLEIDGLDVRVRAQVDLSGGWLDAFGVSASFLDLTHAPPLRERAGGTGRIASAMHGMIVDIAVRIGENVSRGQRLLSIEAMKMEHQVLASIDGRVAELAVSAGQQVSPGRLLVSLEPLAPDPGDTK
jgi:geranyl-CoA carboxylase alpha subunit